MKVLKDLSLLLMLFCISSLVACSSDEEGNTDNPNIPTEFAGRYLTVAQPMMVRSGLWWMRIQAMKAGKVC